MFDTDLFTSSFRVFFSVRRATGAATCLVPPDHLQKLVIEKPENPVPATTLRDLDATQGEPERA
jgi:hypothetical protein